MRKIGRLDSGAFACVAEALLRQGLHIRFVAYGQSMTPAIRNGDVVTVAPVCAGGQRIGPGAVVLAISGGSAVLHRVVGRVGPRGGERMLILQGDSAAVQTESVAPTAVVGIALTVERNGTPMPLSRLTRRAMGLFRNRMKQLRTRIRLTLDVWKQKR